MRATLKRLAAWLTAANIRLHLQWIPSEFNPSDGPSRGVGIGEKPHNVKLARPRLFRPLRVGAEAFAIAQALELRAGCFLELFARQQRLTGAYWWNSITISAN